MQSSIPTGLLITAFLADTFALLAVHDMSTLKTSNYFCAIRLRRNNSSLRDLKDSVPFTVSKLQPFAIAFAYHYTCSSWQIHNADTN